ncbi:hypothetical protein PHYBLDRAFT_65756 [Phycomyces blakesleeanus NRRL 1555(-)]|uniref:F-box domain-containing protein n=2 Tax=Phycomyces blakesleeanus TaxID=4837 RepID=A0A162X881_PHYB8|nr:hypothetical protein PHYBLDRAFT_65756 [Phycomyces blakesleeanus NRRL 1555(-)]OAD73155.1 hypothetical protein PHYBLDRAFT_65756 [Phycomyces blakesleeanus NRRL 1555(-)]|eukprot:XP_018291195.1 hypothetical protein PHYBLDRAFT_65756 [Phycomyces blakesleeanus NRRL 1555(-)]
MLASELLFEITLIIANFLQPSDKAQCCLVCKAWLPAFQESLFETLLIQTEASVNKLVDPTSSASKLLQRYGHRTQTLDITKNILLSHRRFFTLQKHIPNLKHFKWNDASVRILGPTYFDVWNLWAESLTNLEITMQFCPYDIPPTSFNSIRSNLRRLTRLKFIIPFKTLFTCTFDDFELLNDQLPELTYISLSARFDEMSPDELLKVKKVKPRPCLKTLEMDIKNTTYNWLHYLAIKYPNINTLSRLDFSQSGANLHTSQALKLFAELPCPFQNLKNISVHANTPSEKIYLDFISQICLFNVHIKTIDLNIHNSSGDTGSSNDMLQLTKTLANTLEKIKIVYFQEDIRHFGMFDKLEYYPRLVDLDINVKGATVMLDTVLEKCPALKSFAITDGVLNSRPEFSLLPMEYGLSSLSLISITVASTTLNQLSISCKNLNTMHLETVDITISRQKNSVDSCIDMSSTHFTKLYIKSTQFINILNEDRIALFSVSSSLTPAENIWVYSSYNDSIKNRKFHSITLKLEEEESKGCSAYFRSYPGTVRAEYTEEQLYEIFKGFSISRWAKILFKGYVSFKYGSAKKLCFK